MMFDPSLLLIAVIFAGWIVGFAGMMKLVNKARAPWVGLADTLLETEEQKFRRHAEMWNVFLAHENRPLLYMAIGGGAVFAGGIALIFLLAGSGFL